MSSPSTVTRSPGCAGTRGAIVTLSTTRNAEPSSARTSNCSCSRCECFEQKKLGGVVTVPL